MSLSLLVVGATGGLGARVITEALSRGHTVSAFARSAEKLTAVLGASVTSSLKSIHLEDGKDVASLTAAAAGVDAVICAVNSDASLAAALGVACKGVKRAVWTAGASNILEADGVTMHYTSFGEYGTKVFAAHSPCIEAFKAGGGTTIIWCPGRMLPVGVKSDKPIDILTHAAPAGTSAMDFVSYEDAANLLVRAVEVSDYDNKHIAGVTTQFTSAHAKPEA